MFINNDMTGAAGRLADARVARGPAGARGAQDSSKGCAVETGCSGYIVL